MRWRRERPDGGAGLASLLAAIAAPSTAAVTESVTELQEVTIELHLIAARIAALAERTTSDV